MAIIPMKKYMIFIKEIKRIQLILLYALLDMKLMMGKRNFIIAMIVKNIFVKKIKCSMK
jgi:hypothetical protein